MTEEDLRKGSGGKRKQVAVDDGEDEEYGGAGLGGTSDGWD